MINPIEDGLWLLVIGLITGIEWIAVTGVCLLLFLPLIISLAAIFVVKKIYRRAKDAQ